LHFINSDGVDCAATTVSPSIASVVGSARPPETMNIKFGGRMPRPIYRQTSRSLARHVHFSD